MQQIPIVSAVKWVTTLCWKMRQHGNLQDSERKLSRGVEETPSNG